MGMVCALLSKSGELVSGGYKKKKADGKSAF
jgi:hypothetical protein